MSERLFRLLAVVRADLFIRLRRPSTAVVFVLLSILPYLWIPKPSTGRALIVLQGKRALYNSAAIGMATAMMATIFIGLVGFYVISNALRRDVLTRCGYVVASTTMRGSEYIFGKFAGNVAFLTVFTAGFMAVAMAMVIVRGEAPLEPLVFAAQYLLLVPPVIAFVSAIAITFECTPILRSKVGDVLYFFLWMSTMGAVVALEQNGAAASWAIYFDVSGMGTVLGQMKAYYNTNSLSVGAIGFDPAKGVIEFTGLRLDWRWLFPRIGATIWPVAILVVGRIFFHRFDPARVRAVPNEKSHRSWLGRINMLSKPVARVFVRAGNALLTPLGSASFLRSAATDALATIGSFPLVSLAVIGFAIAALVQDDPQTLLRGVMPIAFAGCALAIADVASREKRAGTQALVFATPGLRSRFVWWKFSSAFLVASIFLFVPIVRVLLLRPEAALPLASGLVFVVAAATALGVLSSNPKTFIVGFLTFWYVVMNDKGATPSINFAGWFGAPATSVLLAYAGVSLLLLIMADLFHRNELARRW